MKNIVIFKNKKIIGLIHRIYITYLKNTKQYLASTKTKSEVRGGGRKPWRQKGTGNARAGSIRSPLWVGGGVCFGPKYHSIKKKINKKERRFGILSAFFLKQKFFLFINENLIKTFVKIKTKTILKILKNLNINLKEKILFLVLKNNKNFWLSIRNLKMITISTVNCLNIQSLLNYKKIILTPIIYSIMTTNFIKKYA